ncbi:MAG TPA: hypothetical protein VLK25_00185 [Allosphingosinicella sp.]|nr:hypothetical protein [Allosphingosinicella sp.]
MTPSRPSSAGGLDGIARDYVRLQLELGKRDDGYIDAYYGPPEVRAAAEANPRSLEELELGLISLELRLTAETLSQEGDEGSLVRRRLEFLGAQLGAAHTRVRMLRGERLSFAEEARGLYGVDLEGLIQPLSHYDPILARIEAMVPGTGPLAERVDAFTDRFIIPRDRLEPVMRAAIAECRRRTLPHIPLPEAETFTLELVTNKPWSGYNWYQGNYRSIIQVNTDQPSRMGRVVGLGCHEGYPGHHVLNMLLEQNLARGRGWTEFMLYPLYSPQSFIAEGSANYGVELAFPGNERLAFERRVLYPLAGLASDGAETYLELQNAIEELSGARFTIARDLLEGRITRAQAVELSRRYGLQSRSRAEQSIAFTEHYRAYVINYGLGQAMVKAYIERAGPDPAARWAAMRRLLSEPSLPSDLAGTP